ncbi:ribosome maturation factor RimP [Georgenia sp. TF02-10]|uniref:ribosome maturation factor RimP n=1 Tax=Georgenia sp. TF02-10 TaxID=2917725 RepID=UPI001FA73245|nr:ribosome maturation factor RimP [Georgenia sp. TF02-10]UNX55918.1 ribosome maturation factor RimP [Georgenia sp. TF02-10]
MSPARPHEAQGRLRAALAPVVDAAGLLLEDVTVARAGRRTVVRAVVDLPDGPGGVGSDQLSEVSREVSRVLDDVDAVAGSYTLEVTTPGTDRPLTEPRHYRRAVGRLVTLTTTDGRTVTGRLTQTDAGADAPAGAGTETASGGVVLDVDGAADRLPYAQLAGGRVQVELQRPEQA